MAPYRHLQRRIVTNGAANSAALSPGRRVATNGATSSRDITYKKHLSHY